ncbi:MAG: taurine dioxygenase [Hyphomicrobiaceae bacterium]
MRFEPLTPHIGADVLGLDLKKPLSQAEADQLYGGLIKHLVLFIPDQELAPRAHEALAASFGPLEPPHPLYPHLPGHEPIMLLEYGPDRRPDNDVWHSDVTFKQEPPFASVLLSKIIPPTGGDTLWASMYAAYEALSSPLQKLLDGLEASHDIFTGFGMLEPGDDRYERLQKLDRKAHTVRHPVVLTHPISGRKALYVNSSFTSHIIGLRPAESRALLDLLFEHVKSPEFQVRLRWRPNMIAIWDNRSTQHFAVSDYYPARRLMHRITVTRDSRVGTTRAAAE